MSCLSNRTRSIVSSFFFFENKRERERERRDGVCKSSKTSHLQCHRAVIMMQLWKGWAEFGGRGGKGSGPMGFEDGWFRLGEM